MKLNEIVYAVVGRDGEIKGDGGSLLLGSYRDILEDRLESILPTDDYPEDNFGLAGAKVISVKLVRAEDDLNTKAAFDAASEIHEDKEHGEIQDET